MNYSSSYSDVSLDLSSIASDDSFHELDDEINGVTSAQNTIGLMASSLQRLQSLEDRLPNGCSKKAYLASFNAFIQTIMINIHSIFQNYIDVIEDYTNSLSRIEMKEEIILWNYEQIKNMASQLHIEFEELDLPNINPDFGEFEIKKSKSDFFLEDVQSFLLEFEQVLDSIKKRKEIRDRAFVKESSVEFQRIINHFMELKNQHETVRNGLAQKSYALSVRIYHLKQIHEHMEELATRICKKKKSLRYRLGKLFRN